MEQKVTGMTIERLMEYAHIKSNISAIQFQLQDLEYPVSSPNGKTDGGHGSTPSDPTKRAVFQRLELEQDLKEHLKMLEDEAKAINDWVSSLNNVEIEAIVRWHFLNGLTWAETSGIMYKAFSKDHCRKVFYKFRDANPAYFGLK